MRFWFVKHLAGHTRVSLQTSTITEVCVVYLWDVLKPLFVMVIKSKWNNKHRHQPTVVRSSKAVRRRGDSDNSHLRRDWRTVVPSLLDFDINLFIDLFMVKKLHSKTTKCILLNHISENFTDFAAGDKISKYSPTLYRSNYVLRYFCNIYW